MAIFRSLKLVGRGPAGPTLFELDDIGLKDALGRYTNSFEHVQMVINATSVNTFIAPVMGASYRLFAAMVAVTVAGGSGASVQVVACPGSVAIASGVPQLTAPIDLTVAAPNAQFGVLIPAPTVLVRGGSFGLLFAGTLTGLVGVIRLQIGRVG